MVLMLLIVRWVLITSILCTRYIVFSYLVRSLVGDSSYETQSMTDAWRYTLFQRQKRTHKNIPGNCTRQVLQQINLCAAYSVVLGLG